VTVRDRNSLRMRPRLLVLGDERLAGSLRALLPDISIESAEAADESEGRNVALVVIGGMFPLLDVTQVRVHPTLSDAPAIVVGSMRLHPTALAELSVDLVDAGPTLGSLVAAIRARIEPDLGPPRIADITPPAAIA